MTVIGVDLGTRRVALACPQYGLVFRTDLENARGRRDYPDEAEVGRALGAQCRTTVMLWVSQGLPVLGLEFWFERPLAGFLAGGKRNVRTAVGQGLSGGALVGQLPGSLHQIDSASTWKKELIGDGHAKPADYRAWLEAHHPTLAALCGSDEDLAAATCIGLWAVAQARDVP